MATGNPMFDRVLAGMAQDFNNLFEAFSPHQELNGGRQFFQFHVAEDRARTADKSWEKQKELGNALYQKRAFREAAELYRSAALLAESPFDFDNGVMQALFDALQTWPEESAPDRVVHTVELTTEILSFLAPDKPLERSLDVGNGKTMKAKYPNKGAGIAWSNHAAACLGAGDAQEALESARKATEADPSFVRAHRREMKALRQLGRRDEAKEIEDEIRDYEKLAAGYPSESLALIQVGWITLERARLVYCPPRFAAAAERVVEAMADDDVKKVEARASLVPYCGGQLLMMSLVFGSVPIGREITCMEWSVVDTEGGDVVDQPPQGHASPKALERAPARIGCFVRDLALHGLTAVSVMLGQGLTQHVEHVEAKLREGFPGVHEPYADIVVFHASTTNAGGPMPVPMTRDSWARSRAARDARR